MIGWFATLLIGVALNIVAYLILPQAAQAQPAELEDLESPTNSTGAPLMVIWGTPTIKGLNILRVTNKKTVKRKYKDGGGKK